MPPGCEQSGEKRQLRQILKFAARSRPSGYYHYYYKPHHHTLDTFNSFFVAMASDEVVWDIINQQFCSFKLKSVSEPNTTNFARFLTNITLEPTKPKPSAAMSTTSQASAASRHAPSPTHATQPSAPTRPPAASTST